MIFAQVTSLTLIKGFRYFVDDHFRCLKNAMRR